MAVFSKFAVSVAAVVVGYEEESLATALQLKKKMKRLATTLASIGLMAQSGAKVIEVPTVLQEASETIEKGDLNSAKDFNRKSLKKSQSAPAIPSKDESQLLVTLKEKLTAENRKKLIDQYDEKSFYEALENVEECTPREKESLWKVWKLFREAYAIKKGEFWENVRAKAKTVAMNQLLNDKSCNLLSIVDKLEAHLCEIMEKEEKRLKEQLRKAGAAAINVGLGFGLGALLLVALCCVCHIMEKYCQPEPPCRTCAATPEDNQV